MTSSRKGQTQVTENSSYRPDLGFQSDDKCLAPKWCVFYTTCLGHVLCRILKTKAFWTFQTSFPAISTIPTITPQWKKRSERRVENSHKHKHEKKKKKKKVTSPAGFEPATSGLEVQRAIHCATGTAVVVWHSKLLYSSQRHIKCTQTEMDPWKWKCHILMCVRALVLWFVCIYKCVWLGCEYIVYW